MKPTRPDQLLSMFRNIANKSKIGNRIFPRLLTVALFSIIASAFVTTASAQEIMPSYANIPTGWTVDRYEPASFANVGTYQGRTNVLGISIDSTTASANRGGQSGTFYNTQGRKFTFSPVAGPGSRLTSDLFIPSSWANQLNGSVRSDMWATMENAANAVSAYPIIGFTNYGGIPRLRVWDTTAAAWLDLPTTVNYNVWTRFAIELDADTSIRYYVDGVLVHTDADTNNSVAFRDVIMQAYNFDDPALTHPPSTVIADYTAHWSNLPPTHVTVNTATPNGWIFAPENVAGGSGAFVYGPDIPPVGAGSARITIPTNLNGYILARAGYAGSRLDQITSLSYSTYRTAGDPALAPSFFITIDDDVTDADTAFKGRLVYEAYHTESVNTGVWQTWNPLTATGNWWFSNGGLATTSGCTQANPCSLAQVLTAFPNAGFRNNLDNPIGFKVGSGWTGGYDGNLDNFRIGINGQETLFDFEADPVTHFVDDDEMIGPGGCDDTGITAFETITLAIAAANAGDIIQVCPGTYTEDVNINKQNITLLGAKAGIAAGPAQTPVNRGADESIVIGISNPTFRMTAANGAIIDGFTIRAQAHNGHSSVRLTGGDHVVRNNIMERAGAPATGQASGVISGNLPNALIHGNNIQGFTRGLNLDGNIADAQSTISNNYISGSTVASIGLQSSLSDGHIFSGNTIQGNAAGIILPQGGHTITGNTIQSSGSALFVFDTARTANLNIIGNNLIGNTTGIVFQAGALGTGGHNVRFNRIVGNTGNGIRNDNANFTVNAENNWWGCNYGPGAAGVGCPVAANAATGLVDFNPWLRLTATASAPGILVNQDANITVGLITNSNGVDTSADGNIPNGTLASFSPTLGTVDPVSNTTMSGVTGTVFTAGATPGAGNVATTVDGQTVNSVIGIYNASCASVSLPDLQALTGQQIVVPISVDEMTGRGAFGYEGSINFDNSILSFDGFEIGGTLSSGLAVTVYSSAPGVVSIFANSTTANPIAGAGHLLRLRFTVNGGIGSSSPVSFSLTNPFFFNEGNPCSTTIDGSVTVISGTISGSVVYINGPTTPGVPDVSLTSTGGAPVPAPSITDIAGNYSISGFGSGAYTVTPSKPNHPASISDPTISNADATAIAQNSVGLIVLNANQLIAGDVTGNGTVSNLDATYIMQWRTGIPNPGNTGTWIFIPASRNYPNVNSNITGQNYNAILMGDVTGNWAAPAPFAYYDQKRVPSENAVKVVTGSLETNPNGQISVPVNVTDITNRGVTGYDFDIYFDPNVIEPMEIAASIEGTLSDGMVLTYNSPEKGKLSVSVYGIVPINGKGTLINLYFTAIGTSGSASDLNMNYFIFNEGEIESALTNGMVRITRSDETRTGSRRDHER